MVHQSTEHLFMCRRLIDRDLDMQIRASTLLSEGLSSCRRLVMELKALLCFYPTTPSVSVFLSWDIAC